MTSVAVHYCRCLVIFVQLWTSEWYQYPAGLENFLEEIAGKYELSCLLSGNP